MRYKILVGLLTVLFVLTLTGCSSDKLAYANTDIYYKITSSETHKYTVAYTQVVGANDTPVYKMHFIYDIDNIFGIDRDIEVDWSEDMFKKWIKDTEAKNPKVTLTVSKLNLLVRCKDKANNDAIYYGNTYRRYSFDDDFKVYTVDNMTEELSDMKVKVSNLLATKTDDYTINTDAEPDISIEGIYSKVFGKWVETNPFYPTADNFEKTLKEYTPYINK